MKKTGWVIVSLVLLFTCCRSEKKTVDIHYKLNQALMRWMPYDEGYPLTEKEFDPQSSYKHHDYIEYYKDLYKEKKPAFPFDYQMDLSTKSFLELRKLRAEILARHGFLFMDYMLRAHFDSTFWYQPVFWDNNFKIKLNQDEKHFIARVLEREKQLYKQNYVEQDGVLKANINQVVNLDQYTTLPAQFMDHLRRDGFVINKGNYEQLFYVYDENYYDYTPQFISTDLFLQVMHMHISKEMQAMEQDNLYPLLRDLLQIQLRALDKMATSAQNQRVRQSARWAQTYYAVAMALISGEKQDLPASCSRNYETEVQAITNGSGSGSAFLGDSLMDYSQYIPRANYTRNDTLKRYFRCMKWLNSASVYLDQDVSLGAAILMARALSGQEQGYKKYQSLSGVISFLAGEENNLSINHLQRLLKQLPAKSIDDLFLPATMRQIRASLTAMDPRKYQPQAADEVTRRFLSRKRLFFTAGRYTFDSEIMQKLVHVAKPQPKRLCPKALDVFATMGNKLATSILLNGYKEAARWPEYPDSLRALQQKFRRFGSWDQSVFNKTMQTVLSLNDRNPEAPWFMQTNAWEKRNLNTMLASWSELRHDMLLYVEQPSGAEMGGGGDIPPPQHVGYVEPNIACWDKCIELLKLNEKMLSQHAVFTPKLRKRNNELLGIAAFLKRICLKELNGRMVTNAEFDRIARMGGEVELLSLNIINSDESQMSMVTTPDKCIGITADVYSYTDEKKNKLSLQECVGLADEIYVIAEINGLLYLTRGAVLSQHEFTSPVRLTDEQWQQMLKEKKAPECPFWMKDIKINVAKLKSKPQFSLF